MIWLSFISVGFTFRFKFPIQTEVVRAFWEENHIASKCDFMQGFPAAPPSLLL